MPDGLITSRPLQNEATGIDLLVPQFQEVRGSMMSGHVEYQIVVVTRLAAFKSAKHRPADVVQLVVSKKYSEIEELYCRLAARYPAVPLPAMPRKALFVGETEIRERRAAFDELVKVLSRHRTLATCPELLGFLGAKTTEVTDKTRNVPDEEEEWDKDELDFFQTEEGSTAELTAGPKVKTKPVTPVMPVEDEEEEEVEEVLDPLGILRTRKPKKGPVADAASQLEKSAAKPAAAAFSLFDEEVDPDEDLFGAAGRPEGGQAAPPAKGSSLRLFEDPDLGGAVNVGDSLLLPTAYEVGGAGGGAKPDEDVEELLRVEDTLDKLLTVSKGEKPALDPNPTPTPKAKPALPKKPTSLSQNSAALLAGPSTVSAPEAKIQTMDQMDILRYIQQNEAAAGDDLDLF